MTESIIATFLFWSAFVFSAGAFWTTVMEVANHTDFKTLYKNYCLYLIFGWLPIIVVIGLVVGVIGGFDPNIVKALYFIGAFVILYLAWKIVRTRQGSHKKLDFNWKAMSLLSWTNPKVWISIPPGFLAANFTDQLWLNIALFYVVGIPLFLLGIYMWGMIGRQGAKIAKDKLSYFNAGLLALFASYLLYQGVQLL